MAIPHNAAARPAQAFFTRSNLTRKMRNDDIKIAVFGDEAKTAFKDQKELTGSVFTQMEDAFHYLMLCKKNIAVFRGLERIESPDCPEEVLREALLILEWEIGKA